MARYQLTLAYDGTDFFGSQRQANKRTVQGELEKALYKAGMDWTLGDFIRADGYRRSCDGAGCFV